MVSSLAGLEWETLGRRPGASGECPDVAAGLGGLVRLLFSFSCPPGYLRRKEGALCVSAAGRALDAT